MPDPAVPWVDFPQIYPKRWAAVTLSSGPSNTSPLGADSDITLTDVDVGDGIVCLALWGHATITLDQISCSGESNLTLLTARGPVSPVNTRSRMGYLAATTGSGTKTVTVTLSSSVGGSGIAYAIAVAGHDSADFFEAENFANGSSANGSVDVTAGNSSSACFAIHNNESQDATARSITGGTASQAALANNHFEIDGAYLLDCGAAGSKTVTFTHNSGAWTVNAALFNALGGVGPSGSVVPTLAQRNRRHTGRYS
jgi:hypothetical protein